MIELLVVISIIALLIAMLLPALGSARKAGQASVCSSNLRQIGYAQFSYAADNRDLPAYYINGSYSSEACRTLLDRGYLQNGPMLTVEDTVVGPQALTNHPPALRCPGEPIYGVVNAPAWNHALPWAPGSFRNGVAGIVYTGCGSNVWSTTFSPPGVRYYTNYQFNSAHDTYSVHNYPGRALIAVNDETYLNMPQKPVSLAAVRAPSDVWLAFDGNDYRFSAATAIFRHPGTACNYVYADGHGGPLNMSQVDGHATYTNMVYDRRAVIER